MIWLLVWAATGAVIGAMAEWLRENAEAAETGTNRWSRFLPIVACWTVIFCMIGLILQAYFTFLPKTTF